MLTGRSLPEEMDNLDLAGSKTGATKAQAPHSAPWYFLALHSNQGLF